MQFKRNFCIPLRSGCDLLTLGFQMALSCLLPPGASKMAPEWLPDVSQMIPKGFSASSPHLSELRPASSAQPAQLSHLSSASSAQNWTPKWYRSWIDLKSSQRSFFEGFCRCLLGCSQNLDLESQPAQLSYVISATSAQPGHLSQLCSAISAKPSQLSHLSSASSAQSSQLSHLSSAISAQPAQLSHLSSAISAQPAQLSHLSSASSAHSSQLSQLSSA